MMEDKRPETFDDLSVERAYRQVAFVEVSAPGMREAPEVLHAMSLIHTALQRTFGESVIFTTDTYNVSVWILRSDDELRNLLDKEQRVWDEVTARLYEVKAAWEDKDLSTLSRELKDYERWGLQVRARTLKVAIFDLISSDAAVREQAMVACTPEPK